MMADLLEQLLAMATEDHKKELKVAISAKHVAMKAYHAGPDDKTAKAFEAARGLCEETVARLSAIYLSEEGAKAPEGERFANRKQALNWLQSQGYKVSQGKFYQDIAAGFPVLHRDGTVSRYQVMQYGQQLDVERRAEPAVGRFDKEENEARKAKADADMAEMRAEDMRRERDRDWLHAVDAYATIAALFGRLREALRHQAHVGQGELAMLAGCDIGLGPQLFEAVEAMIDRAFNEVAGGGLDVLFVAGEVELANGVDGDA